MTVIRNKTLTLSTQERIKYRKRLLNAESAGSTAGGIVNGDFLKVISHLPKNFVDLLFLDPPYNLKKDFNGLKFNKLKTSSYTSYLEKILTALLPVLKETATIYICGDWYSSASIFEAASKYFIVRNRITWEREKGRGAKTNWKNSSEDIWFCTMSNKYTFNINAVKIRRRVLAPYTLNGSPKDWDKTEEGNFRITHPSNIWTDITIPFWSMPENTSHPTQKSEKLMAKIILSATNEGDFVFDPFLGSGTTIVTAKKLGRRYLGIERNEEYCLLAEKRLDLADNNKKIQGFSDGVFWERNTLSLQKKH